MYMYPTNESLVPQTLASHKNHVCLEGDSKQSRLLSISHTYQK